MNEIWAMFSNSSIEDDRDAVAFVESHNYVDELEAAFTLGITDFKKGYKLCPKGLSYEEGQAWERGWLAMKCMTEHQKYIPPPPAPVYTGPSGQEQSWADWRWEKFKELAAAQGVDIGERGGF